MIFKNLLFILLLSILIDITISLNWRKKLNQAITKAKQFYKSRYGKDKSWHFLGYDMSEYPGTNKEKRKIQADKWEEYYTCLKKQEKNIGTHGSIIPEAILAFEGESVKFDCKVCLSPSESGDIESVEWEWAQADKENLELLDYSEHILLSPEDKTLHMYNLGKQHTGQYVCKLGKQLTAPYFLTVLNSSETAKLVHPKTAPKGPYAQEAWKIHPEIILDTLWGSWSPCSNCDLVGKRHKYGFCIIILLSNLEENGKTENTRETAGNNETTESSENKETSGDNFIDKNDGSVKISDVNKEILHVFKYGIPCQSHILPRSIKDLKLVKERQNEIMVGYCKIKCPENEIFVVKDKDGNIIESANNSAGIYSTLQDLPPLEPPVARYTQYEAAGEDIFLTCPGNLNSDVPILWQIGSKNVIASLLSQESGGRMFLSISDRIHILKCKVSDSNIYSCWQNKELAGSVRLIVEKRIKLNFNHHIMLIGIVVILSTFLYVFLKAFFGRKYARV